jgi:hypothetical protein
MEEKKVREKNRRAGILSTALFITFIVPMFSGHGEHSVHVHGESNKKREYVYRKAK